MSTDSLSPQTQRSESRLAVETVGLDVIAEADRKGKPADLFMPWFAANISVLGISWGAWVLGFGLSLVQGNFPSHYGGASYRHRDGSPGL